jgi:hypothetical protein
MCDGDKTFLDGILADNPALTPGEKIRHIRYWASKIKPPVPDGDVSDYIEDRKRKGLI